MRRLRVGVIGCGAIAQIHHLPNLTALHEQFEVSMVCDVSPSAAAAAARQFHVPEHVTDYRRVLDSDVSAVLLCHTDPKTDAAIASLQAGKHVFIEKPVCFSLQEIDAMIAAQTSGLVAQAAYVKVYEPGFEMAQKEVRSMEDIRFVQINHFHPDNSLHLNQLDVKHFNDHPQGSLETAAQKRHAACRQAIGEVDEELERAFYLVTGSMIHDLYTLRVMVGLPSHVISAEFWREGRAVTITLGFPNGARCVATWVDLPDLWDFYETLEIYGDAKRVLLSYPTGFARGIPCTLTVQGMDETGRSSRTKPAVDWESAFSRELRHFYSSVVEGVPNRTPLAEARHDVSLIIDIFRHYQTGIGMPVY